MIASRKHFVALAGALTLLAFLLLPGAAKADENYGPWFPSSGQSTDVYNPDIAPFNDTGVSEQTSFACVSPDGSVISNETDQDLQQIILAASDVYDGTFSYTGTGTQSDPTTNAAATTPAADAAKGTTPTPPSNGGYATGSSGMQAFMRAEIALLRAGRWVPYSDRTLEHSNGAPGAHGYAAPKAGWVVQLDPDTTPVTAQEGATVAALIPTSATNPLLLTENLPQACAIAPPGPTQPSFGQLFSSPGNFITDSMLYAPASLSSDLYDFIQPYAFKYTFFTPHTERGDLMWDIPATCSPKSPANEAFSAEQVTASCAGQTPLGYTQTDPGSSTNRTWFLDAATFLQWLISGTYFLILFTAATLYIFRGNRRTQLNVVRLLPRLVLSIVITLMAGFLIGAAITTSNLLVQTIFQYHDVSAVGAVNTFMLQAGNIVGGPQLLQQIAQLLVDACTTFFFFIFVVTSFVRQIALVCLIILAPLAAFSILSPRWQGQMRLYLRCLGAVILLPVVLAFILKVGMSINPLVTNPGAAYGQMEGTAGLVLMVVTLWMMYKAIKLTRDYALHGSQTFTEIWDRRPAIAGAPSSPALEAAVGSRRALPAVPEVGEPRKAEIIPVHKEMSAGREVSLAPRPVSAKDAPAPALPAASGTQGEGGGAAPDAGFSTFAEKRRELGERIPLPAAKKYRAGLRAAIGAATAAKGGKLNPEEVQKIKDEYARANGGRLVEQNGAWYLMPTEPKGFEGEVEGEGPDPSSSPLFSHHLGPARS